MFMRRQLKQGNLFHLGKSSNQQKQKLSSNRLNIVQDAETQQEFQQLELSFRTSPPTLTDFNVDSLAAQNSVVVICCGALVCSLCLTIGFGLFYFVLFDYVKDYVPFITHTEDPLRFLTEANAKQYFAKNQMIAGQFQYPRVPVEYWSHRIQMVKSMGMNSLSVYVFWSYHEIQKGKFDFQTGNKNLTYFLQLCKQHQMEVLLRPGPYVCGEWDWGGLPVRLMAVEGLKIRSSNQLFLAQTRIYFQQLHKVIKKYIRNAQNPHGPILMLQIQNQPGWFTKQLLYIQKLKEMWEQINIGCPFYFDDTRENLDNATLYWDNAIIGMNALRYNSSYYDFYDNTSHFVFGGEVYSGWFSTWGGWEPWQIEYRDLFVDNYSNQFAPMLADKRSFSMYMPHGGTSFGLTAGFNYVTSYDYYAPISEQGRATTNYHVFRSLVMNYTQKMPQTIPAPIQTMSVTFGQLTPLCSLFNNMPSPIIGENQEPLLFQSKELQMFNQGIVLFETLITGPKIYNFDTIIHDIGLIFVDGQYVQTVVRKKRKTNLDWQVHQITIQCKKQSCKLEILVEAMGHSNFGPQMNLDKKGILRLTEKDTQQQPNLKWKHYKFDISTESAWKNTQKCEKAPCLYYIQTDLTQTKDTFINVKDLRKGYIWVNGNNLGRYWEVGPQYSLYCPGVWLKKGKNKILVLDLFVANSTLTLKGQDSRAPFKLTQPVELKK